MKKTVQEILAIEETLSEKVRRCGVQAGCQENAFSALRPGLLQAWSPELLESGKIRGTQKRIAYDQYGKALADGPDLRRQSLVAGSIAGTVSAFDGPSAS